MLVRERWGGRAEEGGVRWERKLDGLRERVGAVSRGGEGIAGDREMEGEGEGKMLQFQRSPESLSRLCFIRFERNTRHSGEKIFLVRSHV